MKTSTLPVPSRRRRLRALAARAGRVLAAGLAGGAAVTAFGLGVHEFLVGPDFEVQRVVVEGCRHARSGEVRHLADVRRGTHLLAVDLERAARGAERHPWVRSAVARREFPGTVRIHVVEREPEMLVALGGLWYVDAQGEPFARASTADLDLPVLTGLDPALAERRPDVARRVVRHALDILEAVEESASLGAADVSEVHLDPSGGFEVVLRSGTRVVLGFADPRDRVGRLDRLVASGLDLGVRQRVDLAGEHVAIATPIEIPTPT